MAHAGADEGRLEGDASGSAPRRGGRLGPSLVWSLAGQGVYAVGQWAILALTAKLLPIESATTVAGRLVMALAICAPLVSLTQVELRSLLAADHQHRVPASTWWRARSLGNAAMFVGAVAAALFAGEGWALLAAVVALAGARWIEGYLDLAYGVFQRAERHDLIARSQIVRALSSLGAFAVLLVHYEDLAMALFGVALAWGTVLVWVDKPALRRLDGVGRELPGDTGGEGEGPVALLRRALPLGLVGALVSLTSNLPRYWIERHFDEATLGIFGMVAYVLVGLALMNQAARRVFLPRMARAAPMASTEAAASGHDRGTSFRSILVFALGFAALPSVLMGVLGTLWGGPLLVLLYNPSLAEQGPLLVWLSVAALAAAVGGVLRDALTATGRLRSQLPAVIVAFVLTAIVAALRVPVDPLLGGAQALITGRLAMALSYAYLLWRGTPRVDVRQS